MVNEGQIFDLVHYQGFETIVEDGKLGGVRHALVNRMRFGKVPAVAIMRLSE